MRDLERRVALGDPEAQAELAIDLQRKTGYKYWWGVHNITTWMDPNTGELVQPQQRSYANTQEEPPRGVSGKNYHIHPSATASGNVEDFRTLPEEMENHLEGALWAPTGGTHPAQPELKLQGTWFKSYNVNQEEFVDEYVLKLTIPHLKVEHLNGDPLSEQEVQELEQLFKIRWRRWNAAMEGEDEGSSYLWRADQDDYDDMGNLDGFGENDELDNFLNRE